MSSDLIKVAEDSARGGFFLVGGTFISTVILAIASIFIARLLGPDLYGQYALSLVLPEMFFTFAGFGIAQGVIKFVAALRSEGKISQTRNLIENAIMLRTLTAIPFFLFNFILADFFAAALFNRPELGFYIRVASIAIMFEVIATTAASVFLAMDKTEYNALAKNLQAIAKAGISVGLVLLGFSVVGALLGHVMGWILEGFITIIILFFILRKIDKTSDYGISATFRALISYGLPLYFVKILVGFSLPYQNLVLGVFASNVEIGNWKAAGNFLSLLTVVSIPISTALFPAFSKLNSSEVSKIRSFFKLATKYSTLLIVPVATLLIIFSNGIVQVVYGSTYETAPLFLVASCLLYFLVGFGYLTLTSLFNGMGETRTNLKTGLSAVIILVVLSPLLANAYGVLGVIASLVIAYTVNTGYGFYIAKRKFKIELDTRALIKIFMTAGLSSIPSLLMLRISPLPGLITIIIGGLLYLIVYATLMPIVRVIDKSELETVIKVTKRIKSLYPIAKPILEYQKRILDRQDK